MKELPIRKFTMVVGYLTEAVTITIDGRPVGTYHPVTANAALGPASWLDPGEEEATVDEIKKAIEPEKVKESRGRLTKGLGEVPGISPAPEPKFAEFRPVPKPGKSK